MADYPYRISYGSVLNQVAAYYGQGSPAWNSIVADSSTGFSMANYDYLTQIGIHPIMAKDGSTLCYYQNEPMPSYKPSTYEVVDSNQQVATYSGNSASVKINGTATQTQVEGKTQTTFNSGAKSVSTGRTVATTTLNVLSGVGIVALAGRLGKAVDDAFYDSGASWAFSDEDWADLYWDSDGLGKFLLNTLYGVDGENGTMYMDEQALAQAYMTMRAMGMYDAGDNQSTYEIPSSQDEYRLDIYPQPLLSQITSWMTAVTSRGSGYYLRTNVPVIFCKVRASGTYGGEIIAISKQPFLYVADWVEDAEAGAISANPTTSSLSGTTLNGTSFYYAIRGYSQGEYGEGFYPINITSINNTSIGESDVVTKIATIIFDGTTTTSGVPGVEDDPQATTYIDPNLINGQDRDTVLQQLKQNYPELFNDSIYQDVPQQDGTNKRITYIPVPMPNIENQTRPTTGANHQNNPSTNPQTNTETLLQKIIDILTTPATPEDIPDTGEGETPPTVVPVGSASSLWKIYNPTQAQVDAFGSWLWDSSFVEQIKKLFNDPMQAIIGIHKVFATPSTGGTATIKVGYLDSQVSSAWVDNQYTTVNCGSASLKEYFGNVFDYAPYTKVQLYLPFIGIVNLDIGDVMRSTISVVYHVDVLTGACLADVKVNRDGAGGVLYQYAGSAIVTYPVSAGNYMGMLAGVLSVAGGIAGTVLSGGALAPALIGGAVGASHLHTDVSHSGGFSGCAGAMGGKKPYLIVSRPQIAMADNYQHYTGIPANSKVTLGSCSGYAKVKSVYVNSITRATEEEKNMIEAQLKAGVLV